MVAHAADPPSFLLDSVANVETVVRARILATALVPLATDGPSVAEAVRRLEFAPLNNGTWWGRGSLTLPPAAAATGLTTTAALVTT